MITVLGKQTNKLINENRIDGWMDSIFMFTSSIDIQTFVVVCWGGGGVSHISSTFPSFHKNLSCIEV